MNVNQLTKLPRQPPQVWSESREASNWAEWCAGCAKSFHRYFGGSTIIFNIWSFHGPFLFKRRSHGFYIKYIVIYTCVCVLFGLCQVKPTPGRMIPRCGNHYSVTTHMTESSEPIETHSNTILIFI